MATPFMGLNLPTVSVTPGPTYATMNNTAFTTIDAHDHSPGNGAPVTLPYWAQTTQTTNYSPTTSDRVILVNSTGGAVTITLPAAATSDNIWYFIKKIDSSTNSVTVALTGGDTISPASPITLYLNGESMLVASDGTSVWQVMEYNWMPNYGFLYTSGSLGPYGSSTTKILFSSGTQVYDPYSLVSSSVATFHAPGIYQINTRVSYSQSYTTSQFAQIVLNKNSGTTLAYGKFYGNGQNIALQANAQIVCRLAVGDTLEVDTFSSILSLTDSFNGANYWSVQRVGV